MSRRRYLSTKISLDAKINRLAMTAGDFAALLYTWMIPHAEDDCRLSGDPEELLMTVMPGRRDKSTEDITAALTAMHELGLIVWDRTPAASYVEFPPDKFYAYQTYITANRRPGAEKSDDRPQQRKSAQNAADQRESPQNAALFRSSLSVSPSVTETDAHASGVVATPLAPDRALDDAAEVAPLGRDGDTERGRWLKRLEEAPDNKRLAILMELAHEKLGVSMAHTPKGQPHGRDAPPDVWGWMGKLAKEHTASLMVKYILQASAEDVLGDPMKYLAGIADRQKQRREQRNGANGRHSGENSPPRTAEEWEQYRRDYEAKRGGIRRQSGVDAGATGGAAS